MSEDIKPYNEDYTNGYKAGFADGWDAAKESFKKPEVTYTVRDVCSLCGIGADAEPLGYPCQDPNCPTRISFNNIMDNTQ